jgi:twitching motility protein PilT
MNINELLKYTVENNASDLHLSAGIKPMVRLDGTLQEIEAAPVMTQEALLKALESLMTPEQKTFYAEELDCDLSYQIEGLARFRVNAFNQKRGAGAVFRVIPDKAISLEELDTPPIFKKICELHHGLILITGPTGSGKSTTMAAMVDHINEFTHKHIITIENPIEFVHTSKSSLINQREIGPNTKSFSAALRAALREDPDIILVGEMRDTESIRLALTAAETGHLVISTLHTNSAPKTIDRIINVFPAGEQNLIRGMLSGSLQAVIAQTLLKKRSGKGRVAAYEIMLCNPAIRNQIRENKIAQIVSSIQTGQSEGMCSMEQYTKTLRDKQLIGPE